MFSVRFASSVMVEAQVTADSGSTSTMALLKVERTSSFSGPLGWPLSHSAAA